MLRRKLVVSIEGNIGAGKSTLLSALKDKYKNDTTILFAKEPLEDFSNAVLHGNKYNPLKDFYQTPLRFAFSTQLWIIDCYKKQLDELARMTTDSNIIIMDRGIYSTNVFTRSLYDRGHITQFERDYLLDKTRELVRHYFGVSKYAKFGVDKLYYLDAPFVTCMDRIKRRNRQEERPIKNTSILLHSLDEHYTHYIKDFQQNMGRTHTEIYFDDNINAVVSNFALFLNRYET